MIGCPVLACGDRDRRQRQHRFGMAPTQGVAAKGEIDELANQSPHGRRSPSCGLSASISPGHAQEREQDRHQDHNHSGGKDQVGRQTNGASGASLDKAIALGMVLRQRHIQLAERLFDRVHHHVRPADEVLVVGIRRRQMALEHLGGDEALARPSSPPADSPARGRPSG